MDITFKNNLKIELRSQLNNLTTHASKIELLENFCLENDVRHLSQLLFDEWIEDSLGYPRRRESLPLESSSIEERERFREWAISYYKRVYIDTTAELLIQSCKDTLLKSPDPEEFLKYELKKYEVKTDPLHDGVFRLGKQTALQGKTLDFSFYHAYSSEILPLLRGYASVFYIKFLKDELVRLQKSKTIIYNKEEKLSHPQIAMLYYYEGWPITENNCSEISEKYGWKPGRTLYNTFIEKQNLSNRINGRNAVKDLKAIIPLLSDKAKPLAESELTFAEGVGK